MKAAGKNIERGTVGVWFFVSFIYSKLLVPIFHTHYYA